MKKVLFISFFGFCCFTHTWGCTANPVMYDEIILLDSLISSHDSVFANLGRFVQNQNLFYFGLECVHTPNDTEIYPDVRTYLSKAKDEISEYYNLGVFDCGDSSAYFQRFGGTSRKKQLEVDGKIKDNKNLYDIDVEEFKNRKGREYRISVRISQIHYAYCKIFIQLYEYYLFTALMNLDYSAFQDPIIKRIDPDYCIPGQRKMFGIMFVDNYLKLLLDEFRRLPSLSTDELLARFLVNFSRYTYLEEFLERISNSKVLHALARVNYVDFNCLKYYNVETVSDSMVAYFFLTNKIVEDSLGTYLSTIKKASYLRKIRECNGHYDSLRVKIIPVATYDRNAYYQKTAELLDLLLKGIGLNLSKETSLALESFALRFFDHANAAMPAEQIARHPFSTFAGKANELKAKRVKAGTSK